MTEPRTISLSSPRQGPSFDFDIDRGYNTDQVDSWVQHALAYIELLGDACGRMTTFAAVHGVRESDAVVQRGKELRAALGISTEGDARG